MLWFTNNEYIQNIDQTFNFLFLGRALGDFEYKNVDGKGPTEQLVSPEPEFYIKVKPKTIHNISMTESAIYLSTPI